jgi:hypothetical protein
MSRWMQVVMLVVLLSVTACNDDPTVRYDSCAEASEAGAAPLYEGDSGYRSALDRDGDGIACDTP